jgi:hypothetical protein
MKRGALEGPPLSKDFCHPIYLIRLEKLSVLGLRFRDLLVAVYDFENLGRYQIDGLLGFDVISQLRLELDGPAGLLTILS